MVPCTRKYGVIVNGCLLASYPAAENDGEVKMFIDDDAEMDYGEVQMDDGSIVRFPVPPALRRKLEHIPDRTRIQIVYRGWKQGDDGDMCQDFEVSVEETN